MKVSRLVVLVVALFAGILAAMIAVKMSHRPEPVPEPVAAVPAVPQLETIDVLVAANDIGMGRRIGAGDLVWQSFPKAGIVEAYVTKAARPNGQQDFVDWAARSAFVKGEPIREQRLMKADRGFMSVILTPGMRATAVEVKAVSSAGGFVLPNDHVDILLTRAAAKAAGGDPFMTETILTNIRVLAIDQQVADSRDAPSMLARDTVTLELTPRQTEIVAQSQQLGTISLALRALRDREEPIVEDDTGAGNGSTVKIVRYGVSSTVSVRR